MNPPRSSPAREHDRAEATPAADAWHPRADLATLRLRARLLAATRAFLAERGVLEVDTPALSSAGNSDPRLTSFTTAYSGPGVRHGQPLYLHTSPEFHMKRLLAAGSGCIYQIAKVFRDGERGSRHNPEFTLLEWYRVGFDHNRLMDEVTELVTALLGAPYHSQTSERLTYGEVFLRHLELDPHAASVPALAGRAAAYGVVTTLALDDGKDAWLDLLFSHCIEPRLGRGRLSFITDYPASQAALARVRPGEPPVAERFELFVDGLELANGFHELTDGAELRRRVEHDNDRRRQRGLAPVPVDGALIAALDDGLPDCAGVALGFDRLLMIAAGKSTLDEVLAFPLDRA